VLEGLAVAHLAEAHPGMSAKISDSEALRAAQERIPNLRVLDRFRAAPGEPVDPQAAAAREAKVFDRLKQDHVARLEGQKKLGLGLNDAYWDRAAEKGANWDLETLRQNDGVVPEKWVGAVRDQAKDAKLDELRGHALSPAYREQIAQQFSADQAKAYAADRTLPGVAPEPAAGARAERTAGHALETFGETLRDSTAVRVVGKVAVPLAIGLDAFDLGSSIRADADRQDGSHVETKKAVGRISGGWGGALAGAAIGQAALPMLPVVGAVIGGVAGGLAGSSFGEWIAKQF
jgi:hypothetical protein